MCQIKFGGIFKFVHCIHIDVCVLTADFYAITKIYEVKMNIIMLFSNTESTLIAAEAARRTAQFALIGTCISALISLFVAILAQRNNKKLKQIELKNSETLTRLNATLAEHKSEQDARRDYDYEARKRLYKECEPLLFRLAEASESALHRIYSLARTARKGDFGPRRNNWLQSPGYYMASTIYHLVVPLAIFRLLQNKLTLVDLTVDQRISNQYLIAKYLYISFTEDFVLAEINPTLEYAPFENGWEEKREEMPSKYWRQGLTLGRLDIAVEGMIKQTPDGLDRCISFGEFETAFYKDLKNGGNLFGAFVDICLNFHPSQRPILWRILIIQAHLHAKLMETFVKHGATGFVTAIPSNFASTDLEKLDWRQPDEPKNQSIVIEPINVAKIYLQKRLPTLFI